MSRNKKFEVKFTRPVFQSIELVVDAVDHEGAMAQAVKMLENAEDSAWDGEFDSNSYAIYTEYVVDLEEEVGDSPEASPEDVYDIRYGIAAANVEAMEGDLVSQPWMHAVCDLGAADIYQDWLGQLELLYETRRQPYFDNPPPKIKIGPNKSATIIPFPPPRPDKE